MLAFQDHSLHLLFRKVPRHELSYLYDWSPFEPNSATEAGAFIQSTPQTVLLLGLQGLIINQHMYVWRKSFVVENLFEVRIEEGTTSGLYTILLLEVSELDTFGSTY